MSGPFRVRRRARLLSLVLVLGLLAGCTPGLWPWASHGSPSPTATPVSTAPIAYATGATDLVLRASSGGGLVPEQIRVTEMPDVSLFGDGSAVRVASQSWAASEPLLPALVVATVTPAGIARILAEARDAGLLGADRRYEMPDVYDLWTTWFVVVADGQTHQVAAYALGFSEEDRFAPAEDLAARHAMGTFFGRIVGLRDWLGEEVVGAESAYAPERFRVFVVPDVDQPVGGASPVPVTAAPGQDVRGWPWSSPPEAFGVVAGRHWPTWRCAVLGAADAAPFGFATATNGTRWRAGDVLYQLVVRPLLPDEAGCPDLG